MSMFEKHEEGWKETGATEVSSEIDNSGPYVQGNFPGTWRALSRRVSKEYEYCDSVPNDDGTELHRARPLDYNPESITPE